MPDWSKVRTNSDRGGQHRALALAEKLLEAGLWDGETEIYFPDPYESHRAYAYRGGVKALVQGRDYIIGQGVTPETPRVCLDATTVEDMAAQLREEGWQFYPTHRGAGFWMHDNGASVNNNGGGFATYEEATRRAYRSPLRQLLVEGHL